MTVSVSGQAYILLALMLLLLPFPWLMAALVAAGWHEICHALLVLGCGGRILALDISWGGIRMETSPMESWKILLCTLAGPAGSLALLLFAPWVPRIALCGLAQGAFNLLPVYPLDGGRAMMCLFPQWRQRGEKFALSALILLTLLGGLKTGWGLPVVTVLVLAGIKGKKPCKSSRFRVQ